MLVVEMSPTGDDILFRILVMGTDCLVASDR